MDEYLNEKYIESILYSSTKILDKTLDIEFLKKLSKYLKIEQNINRIHNDIKEKIYETIYYIRIILNKNSDLEYNKALNEAIIAANNCTDKECIMFYYDQYNARTLEQNTIIFKTGLDNVAMQNIHGSISNDYEILKNIIKPSHEYEKIIQDYIENVAFLHSIKGMYYENTELFKKLSVQINIMNTLIENQKRIAENPTQKESKILNKYTNKIWDLITKR